MQAQDIPAGFSGVKTGNVLGNTVQFVVRADVDTKRVQATTDQRGVSLKVEECKFQAIVEFQPHPLLTGGLHSPERWHVGFVQNLTSGGITFRYGNTTVATVAPEILPCKDAGSVASWYDPSPLSLKRFGGKDEMGEETGLPFTHVARTQDNVRHIIMGDAPGTGNLPVNLPCKQVDHTGRAQMNQNYVLGWRDPLDANPTVAARTALSGITGILQFKTWLAASSESNPSRIKRTDLFVFLYWWEWSVDYTATIGPGIAALPIGRAQLLGEGPCHGVAHDAITSGRDANESVCVKFI